MALPRKLIIGFIVTFSLLTNDFPSLGFSN